MSSRSFASYARALALILPFTAAACGDAAAGEAADPAHARGRQPDAGAAADRHQRSAELVPAGDTPDQTLPPRAALSGQAAALYQQALAAFAGGDLVNARTLFTQTTQAEPQSHQAFYSLGVVQERLRDSGATASYRQAFTIVPDYEPAIIAYAMLQAKKGQLSEAERTLTEKRGQMPKSAAVAATLAEIKSLQKDTGAAQRIAQEALKLNPDYRPAMVIIARDHYRNRRLDLALYALKAVLDGFEPVAENPPATRTTPRRCSCAASSGASRAAASGPSISSARPSSAAPIWSRRASSSRPTCSRPAAPKRRRPSSRAR